jgi:signal transduction histidine kinase
MDPNNGNSRLNREIRRRKARDETIKENKIEYHQLSLESAAMQEKLRQLTHQLISAHEDERREISRELHDGIVQMLVGINLALSALGADSAANKPTPKAKIVRIQKMVLTSIRALHRFARNLRPAILDDVGLVPALHEYSKSIAVRKRIKIHLEAFNGVEALSHDKRTVLFRVAQEALTNVARHARATSVRLSITKAQGSIRMEVRDNGRSFHVGDALVAKHPKRLGLIGMKERVEMVGGHLSIESAPGKGTTVRVDLPPD